MSDPRDRERELEEALDDLNHATNRVATWRYDFGGGTRMVTLGEL